jgi:DNA-binding CsgD family transcriptional regulator
VNWVNRAAETLLGVDRRASCGQLMGQVLKDPQFSAFWQQAREQDDTVLGAVSVRYPKPAEFKVNVTRCLDCAGELIGRVLLFCDVTNERVAQIELSRELTDRLLNITREPGAEPVPDIGLTAQELHVLRLVGNGLGNKEIAQQLHVAPSTLRSHLKSIYRKTGISSRAEAVRYAIQNRLD